MIKPQLLTGHPMFATLNDMQITIDPTGYFIGAIAGRIIESLGVLPFWLSEGLEEGETAEHALLSRYEFASGPMTGGTISEEGVYTHPEDLDLYPLAKVATETETIYFYEYAMVSIVTEDKTTTYRMD